MIKAPHSHSYPLLSALLFFFFVTWSSSGSLLSIWLHQEVGLKAGDTGIIYAVLSVSALFAQVCYGFIQDKLEIKFLILYLAARVIEPVPFDTLLDLTLCDDAVDYFDFSECLADLVKTEHLTLDEESGLYAITEKGRRNSEICETSLPYSVRLRCDKNLNA